MTHFSRNTVPVIYVQYRDVAFLNCNGPGYRDAAFLNCNDPGYRDVAFLNCNGPGYRDDCISEL